MKKITDFDFKDKRVLMRVDYNVPVDRQNRITDDSRIRASLITLNFLLKKNARQVIIMTHFGRPKGIDESLRIGFIAQRLSELLSQPVKKMDDCIDITLPPDRIVLLENLRFHKEEEADDEDFAKKLASLGDVYVNDAFGVSHRAHASVHAITKFIPSCAGFLMMAEVENLAKIIDNPKRPFVAVIGGAKEDKIEVIKNLIPKVDHLIISGMLANTFLKAKGCDLGASKYTPELIETAVSLMAQAGDKLVLPLDLVFADKFEAGAKTVIRDVESKDVSGLIGVDIGTKTIACYTELLKKAKTVFWAGPIGVFEIPEFANGTKEIATFLSKLKSTRVIGGGDSAASIEVLGLKDKMTHVSTGGGASLEFVSGMKLPGIEVLEE
ncbi:MAG: phosphoglycerate kinase [Nanoarchaeota archaeon]